MNENTPARKAMVYYFAGDQKGRKGPRITIATRLSNEYYMVHGKKLDSLEALNEIASIAQQHAQLPTQITWIAQPMYMVSRG